eukprot:1809435-Karenia_brevis.AAC.1
MQQNQALQVAADMPKTAAPKPMYASAILGKPIPENRIKELIGPEHRDSEQNWSQDWEPRDRD